MHDNSLELFATLKTLAEKNLIEFLNLDLDLSFTFLKTAQIEAGRDDVHCRPALEKAQEALLSIRRFQGRAEDPNDRQKIQVRANELEVALNVFKD